MGKGFGGFGGGNMGNIIKQAQQMQKDMLKAQEELNTKIVEATAGGGVIKVVATGKKEIKEIIISPEILGDDGDVEMLQDLILAAVNEALRKAEDLASNEMGKLTGGINIPGF